MTMPRARGVRNVWSGRLNELGNPISTWTEASGQVLALRFGAQECSCKAVSPIHRMLFPAGYLSVQPENTLRSGSARKRWRTALSSCTYPRNLHMDALQDISTVPPQGVASQRVGTALRRGKKISAARIFLFSRCGQRRKIVGPHSGDSQIGTSRRVVPK